LERNLESRVNEIREAGNFAGILLSSTRTDPTRRFRSVRSFFDALMTLSSNGLAPITERTSDFAEELSGSDPLSEKSWRGL
jgi:hypothetical protein